jgi:hypothetical protein
LFSSLTLFKRRYSLSFRRSFRCLWITSLVILFRNHFRFRSKLIRRFF